MQFPDMVTRLPRAKIPYPGIDAYLLQSDGGLMVFFDVKAYTEILPHSHGDQWGIIVEGKIDFFMEGESYTFQKGDSYLVPGGVEHAANLYAGTKLVEFFEDVDRFEAISE